MPTESDEGKLHRLKDAMYSRKTADTFGERPRRMLHEAPPRVGEDWTRPEPRLSGIITGPTLALRAPRTAFRIIFLIAVLFFVGSLGYFAYYFYFGGGSGAASAQNIMIRVSGPTQVRGGTPVELQISITNKNPMPLETAELVITYPAGTRATSDLKTPHVSDRSPLGVIEPGASRSGVVSAVFSGSEGQDAVVHIELEYRLPNSNAIFVAKSDYTLRFISSPLSVAVKANRETVSGQEAVLTVSVSSNTDTTVSDVVLSARSPFGFTPQSSDPDPESENFWAIGDLKPGQTKTVVLRGVLQGEANDERVFHFTAGLRNTRGGQKVDVLLAAYEHHVIVQKPFLALDVTAEGGGVRQGIVPPGTTVNVSVRWKNNLAVPLNNAVIAVRLSGMEIDGALVRSTSGFYRSSDRTILFDKNTSNGALATLRPGGEGVLNFSLEIPRATDLSRARNPKLDISVNATAERTGERNVPETLRSIALSTVKVSTVPEVRVQGIYSANPWGAQGPLPPKVGQETTYAIVFTVKNTTSKISGAQIEATLPPYVRWLGKGLAAKGDLVFSNATSSVTWRIGDIEPGVGVGSTTPLQAVFGIGFTPSESQVGQTPILLQRILFSGLDSWSGLDMKELQFRQPVDITTDLSSSDPGFGKGKAQVTR